MTGSDNQVLTKEKKRETRFKRWFDAPGVEFASPEAKQAYRERVKRIRMFS